MEEKLCCMNDEIIEVLLILRFLNHYETLNWYLYSKLQQRVHGNLLRKRPHLLIGEMLCFLTKTQDHTQQVSFRKNIGCRLVCSTLSTIFTRPCLKWFPSFSYHYKMLCRTKIFSRRSSENVCGKLVELETS